MTNSIEIRPSLNRKSSPVGQILIIKIRCKCDNCKGIFRNLITVVYRISYVVGTPAIYWPENKWHKYLKI